MNSRIRELAAQAKQCALSAMIKIADKEQALMVYSESYDTKFAELIVKKCLGIISLNDDETFAEGDIRARSILRQVKEHFGVKE